MIHGICEYAQRTSSLRMCNTLHENDACILHITHILICSRYFSRCQSEIIQHRTCHLKAVWTCMDNLILRIFFSLEFFALLDWTTTGTVQSGGRHFTWKQHLGNTFLWEAPFQMPGDSLSWKISGVSAFQWFQEFEVFHDISQRDTAKWGPSTNPENLKMLALRHFGICGYLREFCENLRDFCGQFPTFSVAAAFTLLTSTFRYWKAPWTSNCLSKNKEFYEFHVKRRETPRTHWFSTILNVHV